MDLATWHSLDLDDEDWQRELKNEHTASVELGGNASIPQWAHPIVTTDADSEPFPPYFTPTNDFTSQQAAQALTVLAQPPSSRDFHTDNFPDCYQPCDQQCDPDDIFPCFTIDSVPCYDTRCSQTCELDGVNTLCNDAHTEGVKQTLCCLHEGCTFQTYDEAELLHHCTLAHACGGRTHWECRNHTASGSSLHQSHVHNEHCRDDEFINPLLLHPDGCSRKSAMPPHPHMHTSIKLCNHGKHHGHGFDIQSHSPPHLKRYCNFSDHQGHHDIHASNVTRRTKKAKGKLGHIDRVPSNSSQEFSETTSPTELSVASPLNSTCFESIGAVSDADFTADQTFTCCWVADEAVGPCLATFNTAFELQTHVEEFHLASKEQQTGSKKGGSIICRWQDCPYAQSRKSWRQVQHLKDHLRTHTKHKAYRCDVCQRLFSERKSLEQHRRIHTGEKPFRCEECGACFSHQSTLSTHRRTHTGEKPYVCEICGHRDADHANFQRHKLIHEPAQYKCEHCGAEFKKKANMLRHQKNRACKGLKGTAI